MELIKPTIQIQRRLATRSRLITAGSILIILLLVALRIWLASSLQLTPLASDPYDEGLFVKQALQIVQGNWLGEYSELTLVKGPLYPLFIALSYRIGIRTLLLQQWLYCLACGVTVLALKPLLRSRLAVMTLFAVLLFNPVTLTSGGFTRLLREGLYVSLILLVVAGLIGSLLRVKLPLGKQLAWNVLLGISFGLSSITREERVWLTPMLLVGLGIFLWLTLRNHPRLSHILLPIGIPILISLSIMTTIKLVNLHYYQAYLITEYDDPVFKGAYGSLARVKPQTWQALIPISKETRERVYPLSPAFNELASYLEGHNGADWAKAGEWFKQNPTEIGGGWFMWALRGAAASAGYHTSHARANEYYLRLAGEVNALCDSGQLDCHPTRNSLLPVWNAAYIRPILENTWLAIRYTATFQDLKVNETGCVGNQDQIQAFEAISGDRCIAPVDHYFIQGWAFSPEGPVEVSIVQRSDAKVLKTLPLLISPDVFSNFAARGMEYAPARQARFLAEIQCSSSCVIQFSRQGVTLASIPVDEWAVGDHDQGEDLHAYIEAVTQVGLNLKYQPGAYQLWHRKAMLITALTRMVQVLLPLAGILSLYIFLFSLASSFKSKQMSRLVLVDGLLLTACFSRWGLLAFIHSSSFSGINIYYLSCVYSLLILFSQVNIACWLENRHPSPGK